MKLIKLEILNLASLDKQGGETINFEEGALGSTSIFSIVGPTGSGKSTILDAICLALYNRAPRYPRMKGDRNQSIEIYGSAEESEKNRLAPTDGRNILTRGKKEGYSKLTFHANNGKVYRAEWHVYFQVKKYRPAETSLYMIEQKDGGWKETECKWDELPKIIGLDYEQFLRTVLIAQGSFANFLTAKENDRYELLEKLIGCEELYSAIAGKIKEKRDAAQERYNVINAKLETFKQDVLNDEAVEAVKEQIGRLEEEERLLNQRIKNIEKALEWYAAETRCLEEIKKQSDSVTLANEALESIKGETERLELHDALLPATDMLREARRLEGEISKDRETIGRINEEIAKQKDSIDRNKKDAETLERRAKDALDAIEKARPHIQKAHELNTLITTAKAQAKERQTALNTSKAETEKAVNALEQNAEDIKKAQKQKAKAETAHEVLRVAVETEMERRQAKEEEAKNRLMAAQARIEGLSGEVLSQAKDTALEQLNDITAAIETAGRIDALGEELRKNGARQKAIDDDNNECASKLEGLRIAELKVETETLQSTYTLMSSERWSIHRSKLKEGEKCPLCGSEHHPYGESPDKAEETTTVLHKLLQEKKRALDEQQVAEKMLAGRMSKNKGELNVLAANHTKLTNELAAQEQKWMDIAKRHATWTKDKAALEALKPAMEKAKQESDTAWREFRAWETAIQTLTKEKDAAVQARSEYEKQSQAELKKADSEITNANTSLERLKAQTANLAQQVQEKTSAKERAGRAHEETNQRLAQLQQEFNGELDGRNPDEVEEALNKAKATADKAVADKKEEIASQNATLGKWEGSLKTLNDKMKGAEAAKETKSEELSRWIDQYNDRGERRVDEATVAGMLDATEDWEAIKKKKADRVNALTSAKALKAKAEKDMAEHQQSRPARTADQLKEDKETLEQASKKQELQNAVIRLQRHNDAIKNMGDKADELAQATADNDDWKAINDSIGGDGKTLRKIAQCYTLRFLVEHANDEIRKFNSRYELQQVKNSLGIRVIDHDRADDVRDTTSLSGGETFIVSLGLALGLSSLSSRNISFDNLFIDEGFGTLDPETLATVIDSLAMLQTSQGKKVGVISHTDTMSERITTQIRIIKNGNSGSSHIEIYP